MITGFQVRAARAILDWGGDELAEATGLNRDTIHKIENNKVQIRGKSAEKIMRAFIKEGIEFIGDRGVAKSNENYRILEGTDCYLRLLDEVYHALRETPESEVLSICTDDSVSPPEVVAAIQRWHDAKIKCRFLSHENATRFDFPLEEYRLISPQFFKNSVMVVFGNKIATLRSTDDEVLIVDDQDQADMLRGLFNLIWSQAAKPATDIKANANKTTEPQSQAKKKK